jgi:hypothetical protein
LVPQYLPSRSPLLLLVLRLVQQQLQVRPCSSAVQIRLHPRAPLLLAVEQVAVVLEQVAVVLELVAVVLEQVVVVLAGVVLAGVVLAHLSSGGSFVHQDLLTSAPCRRLQRRLAHVSQGRLLRMVLAGLSAGSKAARHVCTPLTCTSLGQHHCPLIKICRS